jgi:hypothetical protein
MVIEFDPRLAQELRASAGRTVGIGGLAAGVLLVLAIAVMRWSARREALERLLEQERRLASLGEMSAVLAHRSRTRSLHSKATLSF